MNRDSQSTKTATVPLPPIPARRLLEIRRSILKRLLKRLRKEGMMA